MMIRRAALALLLLLAPAAGMAQVRALEPVDEAARDPSFARFRERLRRAVRERDTAFVVSILAEDVHLGFGGDHGIASFREMWKPGDPDSPFWAELGEVLRLGGAFQDDSTFVAPYVSARWPGEFDAFDYVALVGARVRVRAAPRPDAPVLAVLSHQILPTSSARAPDGWTGVRLADGGSGYVAERFVRSSIGYRAFFVRRDGRWVVEAFLAGD